MNKNKGFTLLELLVVIGIIAILIAFTSASYSTAQRGGRDARRKSDLKAMQDALEQDYADSSFSYPTTCSDASTNLKSAWPDDPINDATYFYVETCSATTYCICARVEKSGTGNATDDDCGNADWGSGDYFCVGALQ